MDLSKLKDPFPAGDIEWRVQRGGEKSGKPWAMVLAYVTNRAIMERLDDVCGPENWQNDYKTGPNGGLLCGLSINCGDNGWVTKWDGADNTQVEAVKGGLSGAMKRAGSQWGIGRYLYKLDATFATFSTNGSYSAKIENKYYKWDPPKLPEWALPKGAKPSTPKPKDDFLVAMRQYYTTLGKDLFEECLQENKVEDVKKIEDKETKDRLITAMDYLAKSK
jgi:hypothetical protein